MKKILMIAIFVLMTSCYVMVQENPNYYRQDLCHNGTTYEEWGEYDYHYVCSYGQLDYEDCCDYGQYCAYSYQIDGYGCFFY